MTEDRVLKIVSSIMRWIVASESREIAEEDFLGRLTAEGYDPAEIQNAFDLLGRVVDQLKAESRGAPGQPRASARRILSDIESVRMSDDAIRLFHNWQALDLLTLPEAEDILRQVLQSHAGDVEADDLVRFAENSALKGSSLSLYLSAHDTTLQ